jgi:phosphoserine phosphatase RsbU/P
MAGHKEHNEPGLGSTIISDIKRGDLFRVLKKDWTDLKQFYINRERQSRLEDMGRINRFFFMIYWIMKSLFLKLSSSRRILLLLSFFFLFLSSTKDENGQRTNDFSMIIVAGTIILFLLMLELKDKLVARNELEAGRSVQSALLPDVSPFIPGYKVWLYSRPANDVGGDMVDYIKLDDKHFAAAIGDVAGKGLPAALLMAKLQATLRALAPDFSSLSELGKKINGIFYRDTLPKSFASMIYIAFETGSDILRILNAGHLCPIIIRNGEISILPKTSPALGIMKNAEFLGQDVSLSSGDYFIAYSDGVTEAMNSDGEFFGEERLKTIISKIKNLEPVSFGERILYEVDYFVADAPSYDDISIIVIRKD